LGEAEDGGNLVLRSADLSDKMCLAKGSHTITVACSPAPYFKANGSVNFSRILSEKKS